MSYDLIVFDWDGTLMDSMAAIVKAIQQSALDLGIRFPSEAESRKVIGLGLIEAFQSVWPELERERYPDLVNAYRQNYLKEDGDLAFFPGVLEMLTELKAEGKTLAVATGKSRIGLERVFERTDCADFFATTRTGDDCFSKPHPQMLEEIMAETGFEPSQTLMVGDSIHDLLMANSAEVAAIAVTYGAFSKDVLKTAHPVAICDSVAELRKILKQKGTTNALKSC